MGYEPLKKETQELYLKVWTNWSVGHFTQAQLAKLFDCSVDTIANAIKWCAENRTQFTALVLAESAKEAVEAKLRELGNDLVRIKGKEPVNWNAVTGLERLILENRRLLWKLEAVIQDRGSVTVNNIIDNNPVLAARDEIMGGMSDGERQKVLSSINEIIEGPDNIQKAIDGTGVVNGTPGV